MPVPGRRGIVSASHAMRSAWPGQVEDVQAQAVPAERTPHREPGRSRAGR